MSANRMNRLLSAGGQTKASISYHRELGLIMWE